jgi:hypothetical protein
MSTSNHEQRTSNQNGCSSLATEKYSRPFPRNSHDHADGDRRYCSSCHRSRWGHRADSRSQVGGDLVHPTGLDVENRVPLTLAFRTDWRASGEFVVARIGHELDGLCIGRGHRRLCGEEDVVERPVGCGCADRMHERDDGLLTTREVFQGVLLIHQVVVMHHKAHRDLEQMRGNIPVEVLRQLQRHTSGVVVAAIAALAQQPQRLETMNGTPQGEENPTFGRKP